MACTMHILQGIESKVPFVQRVEVSIEPTRQSGATTGAQ
jgi:hypothetical protein